MTKGWTKEREDRVRELAALGWSAGMIAQELNCGLSRNAIIGKMQRKNIKNMNKPFGVTGAIIRRWPKRAPVLKAIPAAEEVVEQVEAFLKEDGTRIALLDLSSKTCRWPVGDPQAADFHYCGHKPGSGKPYCPFHHQMAYQRPSQRRANLENSAA